MFEVEIFRCVGHFDSRFPDSNLFESSDVLTLELDLAGLLTQFLPRRSCVDTQE